MSRILVVYASKHGSTREVAIAIGDRLYDDGHGVDVLDAMDAPSPAGYDGVVVGGSIYMGRWHAAARRYLRRHGKLLAALPLGVFALGPLTMSDHDVYGTRKQLDAALAKAPALAPDLVAVFGGVIDPAKLPFPFKRMPETDARDWPAIRAWANDMAAVVEHDVAAFAH
jgi:menaquinone-dependent protoporphyrinogen oxidase